MYREQYGEYAYWCWGVKGFKKTLISKLSQVKHLPIIQTHMKSSYAFDSNHDFKKKMLTDH